MVVLIQTNFAGAKKSNFEFKLVKVVFIAQTKKLRHFIYGVITSRMTSFCFVESSRMKVRISIGCKVIESGKLRFDETSACNEN